MKAKIICIINAKGGSAKTTTTMALSADLGRRGFRVMVADCDPQASSTIWSQAADDKNPFPAAVVNLASFGAKVHREIQRQLDNYDYILIDTPPALDSLAPQAGLLVADLAIIPLPPSPADLWAAIGAKKLVQNAQAVNEDLIAVVLPSKVLRTSLSKSIMRELENFGIPLMSSRLHHRVAFQEAVISGASVFDLGRDAKQAADEVRAMTDEVLALLGEEK